MAVLTAPASPFATALPQAAGPCCTMQRSGSLWQLGIEAQELIAVAFRIPSPRKRLKHPLRTSGTREERSCGDPRNDQKPRGQSSGPCCAC
jgi:hypothetical protein